MAGKKISEFPDFVGKKLLLKAQKRGVEITGGLIGPDAAAVTLIGLANLLVERGVLQDGDEN